MPPRFLKGLARVVAFLACDVCRVRRGLVRSNLDTAFGDSLSDQEKTAILRASYYHFVLTVFEIMHTHGPEVADHCRIEGKEHLEGVLAKGQGAFILCSHLGNWEVMGAAVNRYIAPVRVLVKKVGGAGTNRFVEERRARIGFHTIGRLTPLEAVRTIQKTVRQNHVVGFVLDQSRPGEPRLPFFGKPAKTNTGLALMAARTQASVVPAFIRREDFGRHVLTFLDPLPFQEVENNRDQAILENTIAYNRSLEEMIRRNPEQYFWLHNRWK